MAQHTDGPFGQAATLSSDIRHIRHITDPDGRILADVRYVQGADQDENLLNASLFAAAPAMEVSLAKALAVLEQLQDQPDRAADIIRQGYFTHALESGRHVLAEARRCNGHIRWDTLDVPERIENGDAPATYSGEKG